MADRSIPREDLDPDAVKIIHRLTRHEHEAYLVGGCVRDLLLNRKPKDFDIGTSATPRQVRRLFRNCRIIGRRFRLAHIYFAGGKIIEVATFRAGNDTDGSEPRSTTGADDDDVMIRDDNQFGTVQQDALRRDFTINQLFYDVRHGRVIDHTDGLSDLQRRWIRTIGDPELRFREDPIRILRAIKFAARLDFDIEKGTQAALEATRKDIDKAAPPRVLEELNRFCRGGAARRSFELMRETRVFEVVLPEWAAAYRQDKAWKRLAPLLDAIDRRCARDEPVETGLILAALILPVVWERVGWGDAGEIRPKRNLQARELVEDRLRPLAVRLRVSRREQERTRQIVSTLTRMLPESDLRPRSRASIRARPALAEAMVLLEALAETWGGEFRTAHDLWVQRIAEGGPVEDQEEHGHAPRTGRRRRRRRSRRRSGRDPEGETREDGGHETSEEEKPAEAARQSRSRGRRAGARDPESKDAADDASKPARSQRAGRGRARRDAAERTDAGTGAARGKRGSTRSAGGQGEGRRPSKWDDDYFFSALPSVPSGDAGDDKGPDRYGSGQLAGVPDDEPAGASPDEDEGEAAARETRDRRTRVRDSEVRDSEARETTERETDEDREETADETQEDGSPVRRRKRRRRGKRGGRRVREAAERAAGATPDDANDSPDDDGADDDPAPPPRKSGATVSDD